MRRLLLAATLLAAPASAGVIRDRIYPAPTEPLSLDGLPTDATLVRVTTADGLTLTGVEMPGRADRPVLLVFHGNASDADDAVAWLRPLAERGYGIVAAEYRGYSGNPGHPSERGLAADADAFLARARALAGKRPIIVVGHSLGSGVGVALAARRPVAALVTVGAFTGMRAMAPRIARAFVTDRYDNLAAVPTLGVPLYLIHGTNDDVVPATMANALYKAARAAGRRGGAVILKGEDHRPDGAVVGRVVDWVAERAGTPFPAIEGASFYPFS
jgi:fermentation-respiration switch protein FrsA (DUF1100 family)